MEVAVKVSVGELLDKLSILEIKKNKIDNQEKLIHVQNEYDTLIPIASEFLRDSEIKQVYEDLKKTNENLWVIEDDIRVKESKKEFDSIFIDLARQVYITNDKRFEFKNKLNKITNSVIQEQKSYNYY